MWSYFPRYHNYIWRKCIFHFIPQNEGKNEYFDIMPPLPPSDVEKQILKVSKEEEEGGVM